MLTIFLNILSPSSNGQCNVFTKVALTSTNQLLLVREKKIQIISEFVKAYTVHMTETFFKEQFIRGASNKKHSTENKLNKVTYDIFF